jgi:hypothetical protein
MSCIEVKVTNLSPPLLIEVERLGEFLHADAFRVDEPLICRVEDALEEGHLKVSCGIVCGVNGVFKILMNGGNILLYNNKILLV